MCQHLLLVARQNRSHCGPMNTRNINVFNRLCARVGIYSHVESTVLYNRIISLREEVWDNKTS